MAFSLNDAPGLLEVHAYINPQTNIVEAMYSFNFLGMCERINSEWEPITRNQSRLNEFSRFIDYKIDWDSGEDDSLVSDSDPDEEWPEHEGVEAFDAGALDADAIKKYFILVHDENGENRLRS